MSNRPKLKRGYVVGEGQSFAPTMDKMRRQLLDAQRRGIRPPYLVKMATDVWGQFRDELLARMINKPNTGADLDGIELSTGVGKVKVRHEKELPMGETKIGGLMRIADNVSKIARQENIT